METAKVMLFPIEHAEEFSEEAVGRPLLREQGMSLQDEISRRDF
jgi:hypothetical protein